MTSNTYHSVGAPAKEELARVVAFYEPRGAELAKELFKAVRGERPPKAGAEDERWLLRRLKKLAPMTEGPKHAPVMSRQVLTSAAQCMGDTSGRVVLQHLLSIYNRGARTYVHLALEAAIVFEGRGPGRHQRTWASMRARGIATLAIVLFYLRRARQQTSQRQGYAPRVEGSGPQSYGFVVRGFFRGAFVHALKMWERFSGGVEHVPHAQTVFGRQGGTYRNGRVGWMAALVDVGAVRTFQPNHVTVPDWEKGCWRWDPRLKTQVRWAAVRIELCIQRDENLALALPAPALRPAYGGPSVEDVPADLSAVGRAFLDRIGRAPPVPA